MVFLRCKHGYTGIFSFLAIPLLMGDLMINIMGMINVEVMIMATATGTGTGNNTNCNNNNNNNNNGGESNSESNSNCTGGNNK